MGQAGGLVGGRLARSAGWLHGRVATGGWQAPRLYKLHTVEEPTNGSLEHKQNGIIIVAGGARPLQHWSLNE
jgi:hypothetical protein